MTFGSHDILHGDVLAHLRELPGNTADALFCDPPYGFSFMGKAWDYDVPSVDVWREALRVLKPGAALLAFGGARTFHRIATGIEDAGFELRDSLCWLYGKGFPKSRNVSIDLDKAAGAERRVVEVRGTKAAGLQDGGYTTRIPDVRTAAASPLARQWEGYGTALKPAWEPIILARKPLEGTIASNVTTWGTGALAIDACRIGDEPRHNPPAGNKPGGSSYNLSAVGMPADAEGRDCFGRWPANVALDEEAAAALDATQPRTKSNPNPRNNAARANLAKGAERARVSAPQHADEGGPSRFFYCAKVSTREREFGCEGLALKSAGEATGGRVDGSAGLDNPRAGAGRTGGARNHHPTLKPLALARWLARLILPPTPDATLLIPYAGAGSEMIGALQAGWPIVLGIEGEAEYIEIARARLAAWGAEEEGRAAA